MSGSAKRVADHRAALRAQGLRPVQIWLPDTRAPEYQARIDADLAALRHSPEEAQLMRELVEFLDWDDPD